MKPSDVRGRPGLSTPSLHELRLFRARGLPATQNLARQLCRQCVALMAQPQKAGSPNDAIQHTIENPILSNFQGRHVRALRVTISSPTVPARVSSRHRPQDGADAGYLTRRLRVEVSHDVHPSPRRLRPPSGGLICTALKRRRPRTWPQPCRAHSLDAISVHDVLQSRNRELPSRGLQAT